jgi:Second Messenger Oligonucleotide or Dinucleotide Synthetase domain
MVALTANHTSPRLLSAFVEWIRPDAQATQNIEVQAELIRKALKVRAEAEGLVVQSTPWSGSFKKKTGIRRLRRDGQTIVEGHDVDLPFILRPTTKDGKEVKTPLEMFARYAELEYPSNPRTRKRSSIHVEFKNTKIGYDLVPLLATPGNDLCQTLIRSDGERRKTSIQKHIEFVTTRSGSSNAKGVQFNDCVRLVKWLRDLRQFEKPTARRISTFLLEILCGYAYDQCSVQKTFPGTLASWFGFIGQVIRKRQRVSFGTPNTSPSSGRTEWQVFEPAFSEINIVGLWKKDQIDELAAWFEKLHQAMNEIIGADIAKNETLVKQKLVQLFGESMKAMR